MSSSRRVTGFLVLCASSTVAACGGGGAGPGAGAGGSGASGSIHLRATVDGQAWAADQATIQVTGSAGTPGFLNISGTRLASASNFLSLTMALGFINGPGTYPLGVNQGTTPGGMVTILDQSAGATGLWATDFSGSRGAVTITSMSATRFAGTFQFTAPPQLGSTVTNTRTVTDGDFELAVPATFMAPPADDAGSTMSAMFGGQPWNAATVTGLGSTSLGVLSFGGSTTGISLSLVTQMAVQAGNTYDQTAVKLMATGAGASCCWAGLGDISSVTITSLTAARVAGTFSATLPPASGSAAAGPLVITGGTFDVRIVAAQ